METHYLAEVSSDTAAHIFIFIVISASLDLSIVVCEICPKTFHF